MYFCKMMQYEWTWIKWMWVWGELGCVRESRDLSHGGGGLCSRAHHILNLRYWIQQVQPIRQQ